MDKYFLNTENTNQKVESIFEEINDKDDNLMEDRIKSKIEKIGNDISDHIEGLYKITK